MNALHAQMNPHFVFNSLNSIREMILNNENSEASRYLSKFAHLIRVTLDQSHHPFISLRHTIDYLNRYIEMEKIRNAHFHFQMILDPALDPDETILPPMLIQPFIENAIWHGVNGADKGIHIRVAFSRRDEHMVCTIDDNGIGIHNALERKQTSAETDHQSLGISNIQHRIDLLNKKYHQQSSVTILDKSTPNGSHETGTIVTITLPLNIERE
jgi:sensor histidine kinase YesM